MADEPCDCYAYDSQHDAHTKAQHTSCHRTYRGPDGACGGCHDCLSAQVVYYRRLSESEDKP